MTSDVAKPAPMTYETFWSALTRLRKAFLYDPDVQGQELKIVVKNRCGYHLHDIKAVSINHDKICIEVEPDLLMFQVDPGGITNKLEV